MINEKNFNPLINPQEPGPDAKSQVENKENQEEKDPNDKIRVEPIMPKKKKDQIAALEEQRKTTEADIDKIRSDIGLPPTTETPPSIGSIQERIKEIEKGADPEEPVTRAEEGKPQEEKSEEESQEEKKFKLEKKHLIKIIDSAKDIVKVFNRRNADKLSPLLDENSLSRIKSAISNIEDMASQKNFPIDAFNSELFKIVSSINSIGDIPKRPPLREDTQSLNALIFKLKNLREESGNLIRFSVNFNPEQTEKTKKYLHNLCNSCEDKWQYIAKLRGDMDNYRR